MIKALFWKEWCEQRWKLAYGCAVLMGFALIGLRSRLTPDEFIVIFASAGGSILMALFVGMGLIAAERNEGSLEMLLALPVRPWKIFAVKMAMGTLVCTLPIIGCMAVTLAVAGGREMSANRIAVAHLGGIAFSFVMLVWMVAFSIRQPNEARTGLVGIEVFVGWVFFVFLFVKVFYKRLDLVLWGLVITPLGILQFAASGIQHSLSLWTMIVQTAMLIFLLLWGGYRFGKEGRLKA
jgi:ABC-type transport system involved in multi-copper enzyme maturation permease subunit